MTENMSKDVKKTVYGVIIVIAIVAIMAALAWYFRIGAAPAPISVNATVGSTAGSGTSRLPVATTVHSEAYGFDITAPAGVIPEASFKKYYDLSDAWRALAPSGGAASVGVPVVSLPILQMDNTQTDPKVYPLYFDAEVRVGVSSSTATCYQSDAGVAGETAADATINGVAFKKFSFSETSAGNYLPGESYRTVHDGLCFAVEQVKTGSSYRQANMEEALSDSDLAEYYAQAAEAVQTFKFTK